MKLINIGFGSMITDERLLAVLEPVLLEGARQCAGVRD